MVDGGGGVCHTDRKFRKNLEHWGIWMMKKVAISLLAATFVASAGCKSAPTHAEAPSMQSKRTIAAVKVMLTDLTDHWARDSILEALSKGYVDGYEDATFRPDVNVSRAEFIKMVVTAMKLPVSGTTTGAMWYMPYVNAAKTAGFYQDGDFRVDVMNEPITRVEMAKLSLRATDKSLQNPAMQMDKDSVMYNAAKKGLIQGLGRGELSPEKTTTRAQSVTVIERILTVIGGGTLPIDKYAVSNAEIGLKKTNIFSMAPEIFGGVQAVKWDPENLFIASSDGKYKGVIDSLILIDMADQNDPNRSLLGDIDSLQWLTGAGPGKDRFVKDYPDSYVLVFNMRNELNQDSEKYVADIPRLSIPGFISPDEDALRKGTLNTLEFVYRIIPGDMMVYIIPKHGYMTNGEIDIKLNVPTRESKPENKVVFGVLTQQRSFTKEDQSK